MKKIGILHPGEMGISVAAATIHSGHEVYWVSQGRSEKTQSRAKEHKLINADSLTDLCQTCEIILSICPSHAAESVARSVVESGFHGLYLDANAIAPQRSIEIGQFLNDSGIRFVDGGIIGGPAWTPNTTCLYLSGEYSEEIASCFSMGPLQTRLTGKEIGKASALKMCYAAYSKGTTALLAAILATAEELGVREDLNKQWDIDDSGFSDQANQRVRRVTAKAWRFEGEMREISATFQKAGLPGEFHAAAAHVYHRMAEFKDTAEIPPLNEVIEALLTE